MEILFSLRSVYIDGRLSIAALVLCISLGTGITTCRLTSMFCSLSTEMPLPTLLTLDEHQQRYRTRYHESP